MENSKEAIIITIIITSIVAYKRYFSLDNLHDFQLKFGRDLLNPRLRLFGLMTAFVLTLPLNSKVGDKAYKEATGYYIELQNKNEYMTSLKEAPIKTLALEDPQKTSKYLGLPLWLAEYISVFSHNTAYVLAGTFIIILTLTSILLWKIIT